jgi:hypothetical protein
MRVSDLIEKLKLEDPDATVLVWDPFYDKATDVIFVSHLKHKYDNVVIGNFNFD